MSIAHSTTTDGPTYAKIIGKNFGSYPYRVGLNTLAHNGETFDADLWCRAGGLYYCELKDILEWMHHGDQLCIVKPVGQIVDVGHQFKTDRLVIESIMDLREVSTWEILSDLDADSALQVIAKKGYLKIVKFLVEQKGADIHMYNDFPLKSAAGNGHLEVVEYFVEHGADIHTEGESPLQLAAENGHSEVVKFLVERGANIQEDENYALCQAAEHGHFEIVKFLVERGANVRVRRNYALRWAIRNDHFDIGMFLADIIKDNDYVLKVAAEYGNFEIMKNMVERGADIHADANVSMRLAAANGHLEIVKFLVDRGADVHAGDNYAMRWAVTRSYHDVVEYLKTCG